MIQPIRYCRLAAPAILATMLTCAAAGAAEAPSPATPGDTLGRVTLLTGTSQVIRAPWQVARVSVTDPDVADVRVLTPTQVLLTAVAVGATDLILWGEDEQIVHTRVDVLVDLGYVEEELKRFFPDAQLKVRQSRDMVIVEGKVRRASDAARLREILDGFGVRYVDSTVVAGVQQVELHVRVAEVSRRDLRQLGMNAFAGGSDFFGGSTIGPSNSGPINPINIGAPQDSGVSNIPFSFLAPTLVSSGITLFGGVPSADLQFFIQALAENQYVKVLAEPTLIAISGEEANFLAGGEFPIPVAQGTGGGTSISVEYREFGVRLRFLPIVLGDGAIRLRVAPEVSDLSDLGSVEFGGFRIPSILTRRSETTLELRSGQTFAMAGLINQSVAARATRVPVLGDLPILGPLFRSVRYQRGDTELVVLVTASLVEPMALEGEPLLPGMLHTDPNDWELFIEGRMSGVQVPEHADALQTLGLDRLEGPGAWASFAPAPDQRSAPRRADRRGSNGSMGG